MALDLVDQQKSIMRFVEEKCPGVPIVLEKSQAVSAAPAILVEHVRSMASPMMATAQQDISYWKITYLTADYWAGKKVTGQLKAAIQDLHEIPAYLFDFVHPAPTVEATTGTLPAGLYTVQVAGIGRDGAETLPSEPVEVTLAEPGAVSLCIPRLEQGVGTFRNYRVYLNGRLATKVAQDPVGNTTVVVADLADDSAWEPVVSSVVLERYFYVEDVRVISCQGRDENGLFSTFVRLKNRLTVPKQVRVGEKVAQVSASIAAY